MDSRNNYSMSWRRSEWITVGGFVLVAGWIWAASAKSKALDDIVVKVEDKESGIVKLNIRVTVLEKEHQEEMGVLNSIADAVGAGPSQKSRRHKETYGG